MKRGNFNKLEDWLAEREEREEKDKQRKAMRKAKNEIRNSESPLLSVSFI